MHCSVSVQVRCLCAAAAERGAMSSEIYRGKSQASNS